MTEDANTAGAETPPDRLSNNPRSDYFDQATAISGAVSDGTFSNPANSLAVAWRADRMVYYSPGNTGSTYGTGDWAMVTCEIYNCSTSGGQDI